MTPTWLRWHPLRVTRWPIDFLVTLESYSFTVRTTTLGFQTPHAHNLHELFLYFPVSLLKLLMFIYKNPYFVFVFMWSGSRSPRRVKDDETDESTPVVHWTLQHEAGECCHLAAMCRNTRLEASVSVKATLGLVQTEKFVGGLYSLAMTFNSLNTKINFPVGCSMLKRPLRDLLVSWEFS